MAMPVQPLLIGIDVSKQGLDICDDSNAPIQSISNDRQSIAAWLDSLPPGPVEIALEATSTFHLLVCELAFKARHTIYLIDGFRLSRYRDSVGIRAKNDASDARLLRRYLVNEHDNLRPWSPPPKAYTTLLGLLNRRAVIVQAKTKLRQSLADLPGLKPQIQALFGHFKTLERKIDQQIQKWLEKAAWKDGALRVQAIEGIGPLTAAALVTAFQRGSFRSSDAFIAFLGMDVRVHDSGQMRGRRKLTKKGNAELRRLLYLAAMRACRTPAWRDFYQRYLDRGLAPVQALVILGRKLARVAFAILRNETEYRPKISCMET